MTPEKCHACEYALDADDNFCRRCGMAVGRAELPAVRGTTSVTLWQPNVSPVVKGAAVMAAGTIGQFLLRRAVSSVLGSGKGAGKRSSILPVRRRDDGLVDEAQIITETVMMRRVRIRRPA